MQGALIDLAPVSSAFLRQALQFLRFHRNKGLDVVPKLLLLHLRKASLEGDQELLDARINAHRVVGSRLQNEVDILDKVGVPPCHANNVANLLHTPQAVECCSFCNLNPQLQENVLLERVHAYLEHDIDGSILLRLIPHLLRVSVARTALELDDPLLWNLRGENWLCAYFVLEKLLHLLDKVYALLLPKVAQNHYLVVKSVHQLLQEYLEVFKAQGGQNLKILFDVPLSLQAQHVRCVDCLLVRLVELHVLQIFLKLFLQDLVSLRVRLECDQALHDLLRQGQKLVAVARKHQLQSRRCGLNRIGQASNLGVVCHLIHGVDQELGQEVRGNCRFRRGVASCRYKGQVHLPLGSLEERIWLVPQLAHLGLVD
mmetsp:Transcript_2304/g.3630  ORF Transcript_2304/g.3630 Transcript_2304/m.3630 type:complete len:371 (-) Transcript_2304:1657-2769(-)